MPNIVLYTIECPMCKRLEEKLKQKNVAYKSVTDKNEFFKIGIKDFPMLQIDEVMYSFKEAVKIIEGM